MIGPHEVKFHFIPVFCLQETVIQTIFQIRHSVKPVPVINEYVDAMLCCRFNFHLHHSGIRLIHIPPQRLSGPLMPRKFGHSIFYRLPLPHSLRPEHEAPLIPSGIRRPHISRHIIVSHLFLLPFSCRPFYPDPKLRPTLLFHDIIIYLPSGMQVSYFHFLPGLLTPPQC